MGIIKTRAEARALAGQRLIESFQGYQKEKDRAFIYRIMKARDRGKNRF